MSWASFKRGFRAPWAGVFNWEAIGFGLGFLLLITLPVALLFLILALTLGRH